MRCGSNCVIFERMSRIKVYGHFLWKLFFCDWHKTPSMISQHWFREFWLCATSNCLSQWSPIYTCAYPHFGVSKPQWLWFRQWLGTEHVECHCLNQWCISTQHMLHKVERKNNCKVQKSSRVSLTSEWFGECVSEFMWSVKLSACEVLNTKHVLWGLWLAILLPLVVSHRHLVDGLKQFVRLKFVYEDGVWSYKFATRFVRRSRGEQANRASCMGVPSVREEGTVWQGARQRGPRGPWYCSPPGQVSGVSHLSRKHFKINVNSCIFFSTWLLIGWRVWCLPIVEKQCLKIPVASHYDDVIMSAMALKPPASRLFTQAFIQAQIKENIKASRLWSLWGEFTGDRWIPRTKCSNAENVSIWWRHHELNMDISMGPWNLMSCCDLLRTGNG